ncbi:MAG TPA: hypothetical protein PK668_05000 [Myxococcota bacterium]|nr:hypothetical protein [Myxococcota bacterium]HRY92215.1 hypothetical protein [Myxococcota bacterium]
MAKFSQSQQSLLASIKATATDLNEQADKATELIEALNAELAAAGVGIEVWGATLSSTTFTEESERDDSKKSFTRENKIGFARCGAHWCLVYGMFECEDDFEHPEYEVSKQVDLRPLSAAPREARILALPHLEELLVEVQKELGEALTTSKKALDRMSGGKAAEKATNGGKVSSRKNAK